MSGPLEIRCRCLVAGEAEGPVAVLQAPLSLWGGFDPHSGRIVDAHHPQHGLDIAGRILVMPGGRGSSSSASILLEAVRLGRHPLALVLGEADPVLVIGALVAADLYGVDVPVVETGADGPIDLPDASSVRVSATSKGAFLRID